MKILNGPEWSSCSQPYVHSFSLSPRISEKLWHLWMPRVILESQTWSSQQLIQRMEPRTCLVVADGRRVGRALLVDGLPGQPSREQPAWPQPTDSWPLT